MTPAGRGLQLQHNDAPRPRSASSVQRREELAQLSAANATIARLQADKAQLAADLAEARALIRETQAKTRKVRRALDHAALSACLMPSIPPRLP